MAPVIVYPNNTVTQAGESLHWTDEDFRRRYISKDRPVAQNLMDDAEHRVIDGQRFIIFGTRPLTGGGIRRPHRFIQGKLHLLCIEGRKTGCGRWLPEEKFHRNRDRSFNRQSYCIECMEEAKSPRRSARKVEAA